MRRILALALLLAILAATGWTLYHWNRAEGQRSDVWRAIPERSAAVLIIPDGFRTWDRVSHTSQFWASSLQLPAVSAVEVLLSKVKNRMENDEVLRSALGDGPVQVALMRNGGNALGCLFTGQLNEGAGEAKKALTEVLGLDASLSNTLASGAVVQLQVDTALPTLSLCIREGVWMLGNSPSVMDEALLQWDKRSGLQQDSAFVAAQRTLGAGSDGHLLFRGDRAVELALLQWSAEALEHIERTDRWVALDIRSRSDMLLLSGLIQGPADKAPFSTLHDQAPGPIDGTRMLPRQVVGYRSWHISDPAAFLAQRDPTGEAAAFYSWVQGSVGVARAADSADTRWAVLHASDLDLATERFLGLCSDACDTSNYRGILLRRLPPQPAVISLLNDGAAPWGNAWWAPIGTAVVLANDLPALRASIDAWTDGRSLAEEPRSATWWARLGNEAGATWWSDVGRSEALFKPLLQPAARTAWERATPFWSSIGNVSLHLNPGQRGTSHLTIAIQYASRQQEATTSSGAERWAVELHAPISRHPEVFVNHTNGTHEVLVQDDGHRIHLIGSSGRVLWSRSLDGPILGRVQQIDRFRNGKLQFLFNTAGSIQLIDRNGRDVGGFPVNLEHRATAPLAVFDYEGNGDFRILVPLANGGIDNRSADGQQVKGWQPERGGHRTYPVQHLRIRNKDHLVLIDSSGAVQVLDRKGQVRERVSLKLTSGATILAVVPGMSLEQSSVWWQGTNGAVQRATLDGKREQLAPPAERRVTGGSMLQGPPCTAELRTDSVVLGRVAATPMAIPIAGVGQATHPAWQEFKEQAVFGASLGGLLHIWNVEGRPVAGAPFKADGGWCVGDLDRDGQQEVIVAEAGGRVVCLPIPAE